MYIVFVFVFQMLTETVRNPKLEFYFDKMVSDTFIENHFDSSHNTLESVRRTADIWEWGNTVLWPGLFANIGPCGAGVGNRGGRRRSIASSHRLIDRQLALQQLNLLLQFQTVYKSALCQTNIYQAQYSPGEAQLLRVLEGAVRVGGGFETLPQYLDRYTAPPGGRKRTFD